MKHLLITTLFLLGLSFHAQADELVELNVFESISTEAVRQTLKKTNLSLG